MSGTRERAAGDRSNSRRVDLEKSHETLQRIERLRWLNSQREWVNDDLYRLMYKEDLYIIAYERIKSKPGNMTPGTDGETLDGWSLEAIQAIIHEMRNEQFQFKPVRTVYISKPNGKMRKLGIPSTRDKVVQEVIRMILEAIYDSPYGPYFRETSHGFRPRRSCHTALREIRVKWAAANWFVEGDIRACFDEIDHSTLVSLLRRKIKDERFLNLIWKLLRAGYLDLSGERKDSLAGTPQGGLVSPILANIYLHELDEKVEELRKRLEKGKRKRTNSHYRKLLERKQYLAERGQANTREFRDLIKQIRATPAVDVDDPGFIRVKYVRYCDDWIIGVSGPHALAEQVKEEIKTFLVEKLHLTLSEDKTHITSGRKGQAQFLGTRITIGRGGQQRVIKTTSRLGKTYKRRSTGWETVMIAPIDNLIQRLHRQGFCTATGEPTTKLSWVNLDPEQVIGLYSSINRGIQNYYRFADNFHLLNRIQYILKFSLAKTFAAKYKVSVRRVFTRFGKDIMTTVKAQDGKGDRFVSLHLNSDWETKRTAFTTDDRMVDLVQTTGRMRARSKLGKPCCICGSLEQVEMHHVRHIRKAGDKKPTGIRAIMQALNRKQIPACKICHLKIHRGEYDGIRLADLVYEPR
jgi:group II intron reverse transcriptase/maturase